MKLILKKNTFISLLVQVYNNHTPQSKMIEDKSRDTSRPIDRPLEINYLDHYQQLGTMLQIIDRFRQA